MSRRVGRSFGMVRKLLTLGSVIVALAITWPAAMASPTEVPSQGGRLSRGDPAIDTVRAALVHVRVFLPSEAKPKSGTAFVIARRAGYAFLLTAYHVVHPQGGQVVRVALDGGGIVPAIDKDGPANSFEVAADRDADLALLSVPAPDVGPVAPLGHPESEVRRQYGATILGFGELDSGGSLPPVNIATGTLNSRMRQNRLVWISNAPIVPGMSGGPVIGGSGRVIGVAIGRGDGSTPGMTETTAAMVTDLAAQIERQAGVKISRQRAAILPALPQPLLDRPEEPAIYDALTQPGQRHFVVLVGTGGTGKSVLAAKVADKLYRDGRYPDGVFWIDVAEQPPEQVLSALLNTVLGQPQSGSIQAMADLISSSLTPQTLVILDDLREDRPSPLLLKTLAGADLLVTSRRNYSHDTISATIPIGQLSQAKSRELLRGILKLNKNYPIQLVKGEELDILASRLGQLPLALRLAAGAMAKKNYSVQQLMSELESKPVIDLTPDSRNKDETVRAVLSWWWKHLQPREREVLTATGQLAEAVMPNSLVLAADGNPDGADALEQLALWSIVDRVYGDQEIKMHPLVHEWAQETGEAQLPATATAAKGRMAAWLVNKSYELNHAKTWKPYWSAHVEKAMLNVKRGSDSSISFELASKWNFLLSNHDEVLRSKLWQQAVEALASSKNLSQRIDASSTLADILEHKGLHEDALARYEECVKFARQSNSRQLGYCLVRAGLMASELGKFSNAEKYYKEAQGIYEADKTELNSKPRSLAVVYHNLYVIESRQGNIQKAQQYKALEEKQKKLGGNSKALANEEDAGDGGVQQKCTDSVLHQLKDVDAGQYLHALTVCASNAGMSKDESYIEREKVLFKRCIDYAQEAKFNSYEALCMHNLAVTALNHGDSKTASKYALLCVYAYGEINKIDGMADCYDLLGASNNNARIFAAAYFYLKESLVYRRQLQDKHKLMKTLRAIALVTRNGRDWCTAEKYINELIELSKKYDPVNTSAYESQRNYVRHYADARLCLLMEALGEPPSPASLTAPAPTSATVPASVP